MTGPVNLFLYCEVTHRTQETSMCKVAMLQPFGNIKCNVDIWKDNGNMVCIVVAAPRLENILETF